MWYPLKPTLTVLISSYATFYPNFCDEMLLSPGAELSSSKYEIYPRHLRAAAQNCGRDSGNEINGIVKVISMFVIELKCITWELAMTVSIRS
jgi:hypothetical protein